MRRDREVKQNLGAEVIELLLYGLQMGLVLAAAGAMGKLFGIL